MDLDRFCKKIKNRKHDFAPSVKRFYTMKNILTVLKECGIENPLEECSDFGYFWDEDDDYICEDEERTAFEK